MSPAAAIRPTTTAAARAGARRPEVGR